jgi:uncharacterized protein YuzE
LTLERHPGEWTYDPEAGAAYVYLNGPIGKGEAALTHELDAAVNLDYDADGRVVGVEIIAKWPEGTTP